MKSVENKKYKKCGVENEECGKCGLQKLRRVINETSYIFFFVALKNSNEQIKQKFETNAHSIVTIGIG